MKRAISAGLGLLAWGLILSGCGSDSPAGPTPVASTSIVVEYVEPDTSSLPPGDPMCYHHGAPMHLMVTGSWGETSKLDEVGTRLFRRTFTGVPASQDQWLTLFDINLCATDAGPLVRTGVSVNGIALTRTVTNPSGVPALAFYVDAYGKVHP